MAINVEKRKHDDDHSGNDSPVAKKVRIKLSPEVEKQFEALKKRMKKLKKAWLKKPDNDDAKAAYRASQKAVFEFTKTLSSGGPKPTEASESDADAPLKSLEAAYREARRKWKKDRKNDELFQAMKKAKAALDEHVPTSSASNADESAKPPASTSFEDAQAERAARALRLAEQRRRESELGVNQPPPTRGPVATASAFVPSSQSKVSPPQSQRASTTNSAAPSASFLTDDELQANLAAAKKAWKKDRSNDELFQAMQAAKAAIVEAEAARAQAKVAPRVPVQENQPAVAAPTSDTASTPISQAEVDELAAKAAAAKKQWKKDRSNDDLFAEMQATKKAHQEAQERFEKQKTHITAAPSPASQVEVPVNPLASSKSLEELRKDMQDARKAWKIDRSDSDLRAKYERAKEVFEFNEANPGAKAALTVAAAIRGPTQHTRGQTASLEELEAAMKEARRVWKIDRDNKELRAAYDAAKTALEHRRANPVGQTMGEAARATLLAQGGGRGCTIQLANLSFQITEEEIRAACAEIGDPLSITYCENAEGKFNGCALLTFESSDLASTAIKQLRGTLLGERKLKAFLASGSGSLPATDRITRKHNNPAVFVKPSQPAENPTQCVRCFVGNLKFNVDEESLGAAFREMGINMKNVTFLTDRESGEFYGSSFATFESADDAAMAVACTGMKILGRPANIHFAEKRVKKQSVGAKSLQMRQMAPRPTGGTYKAFFGNLSYDIDEKALTKFCEEGGAKINDIRWLTHKDTQAFKGSAFVDFDSVEAVDKIVLRRGDILLGRPVRIDYA